MPQIFHRSTNTVSKLSISCAVFILAGALWVAAQVNRSPYVTQATVVRDQPVPFSHKHHVGDVGLDCRYCHTSVETSATAGLPSTQTCMNCHSMLFNQSPILEPVRSSFRSGKPIAWTKVHDLPDFAYFDHSIHISKGVGCATCHGKVDQMPLMWQTASLQMEWCLSCHREPERYVRPRDQIYNLDWEPNANPLEEGRRLVKEYKIQNVATLTSCSTCHR
ncbi:MAG: cytochrome c3 family protein [Acidobacteria bacterium]|nr:cytochrome c3 family protein [Acidobacteriota bacterium]